LPIVQSGATVKVSVDNLTVGRDVTAKSLKVTFGNLSDTVNLTNANGAFGNWTALGAGLLIQQKLSPPYECVMQTANAANSFQFPLSLNPSGGDVSIGSNLVIGTAGKGIDFSANTGAAGMTSELLNWYEEGTWEVTITPETSGTITLSSSFDTASYVRVGRNVHVQGQLQISSSSLPIGTFIKISLPFAIASLLKLSGRFGTTVNVDFGGSNQILFATGVSGDSFISAYVTASTATSPRNIWFSFSYAT
jgi:hypothetical protein